MKKSTIISSIILILLAAFMAALTRLSAAEKLPVDYDEDDYLIAGLHYAEALRTRDLPAIMDYAYNQEHPPLAKIVYGVALSRFDTFPTIPEVSTSSPPASSLPEPYFKTARLTSVLLGWLEVVALAIANPLGGFLLAIHTFTVKYTSQVMLEALPALLSLLSVLAFSRSRKPFDGWKAASAILLGLTAASKYMYAVAGLAMLVFALTQVNRAASRQEKKRMLLGLLLWGGISLASFFMADPFLWRNPIARLKESLLFNVQYSQSQHVTEAGYPFWQPLTWILMAVPWHPTVFLPFFDLFIALFAVAGLRRTWEKKPLFIYWLAIGMLFLFLWRTKWPQYILIITAPLAFTAAEGMKAVIADPVSAFVRRLFRKKAFQTQPIAVKKPRSQIGRALPWLIPGMVVLALITIYPLVYQGAMSLTDFSSLSIRDGLQGGVWREVAAGLSGKEEAIPYNPNAGRSFSKEVHYIGPVLYAVPFSEWGASVLGFEIVWTILSVLTQILLGVGVALILHQRGLFARGWWRTLFILPWAIPEFVGAMMWSQMYDPKFGWVSLASSTWSQQPGYLNVAGLASTWQQNPNQALIFLLVAGLWYGFPLMLMAASAGLKALPSEVFDAAAMDGASRLQTFTRITWPMLLPLLIPAILLRTIQAFNQFYLIYVLNPPQPLATLSAISYYIFNTNGGGLYALSAAINVITLIILIIFILYFNRITQASEGVTYA